MVIIGTMLKPMIEIIDISLISVLKTLGQISTIILKARSALPKLYSVYKCPIAGIEAIQFPTKR
jgi:hypothetical protein